MGPCTRLRPWRVAATAETSARSALSDAGATGAKSRRRRPPLVRSSPTTMVPAGPTGRARQLRQAQANVVSTSAASTPRPPVIRAVAAGDPATPCARPACFGSSLPERPGQLVVDRQLAFFSSLSAIQTLMIDRYRASLSLRAGTSASASSSHNAWAIACSNDHQRDTHPLLSTSYGLITTFSLLSAPAVVWKALASRVASSCKAPLVRSVRSHRSTLILVTSPSKSSGLRIGTRSIS